MSIGYTPHYGIGFKVEFGDGLDEEIIDAGLEEYLDYALPYSYNNFRVGNSCLDDTFEFFVIIYSRLSRDLDLNKEEDLLREVLKEINVEPCSEFKVVGGLEVW